jgi:hypothetical protein
MTVILSRLKAKKYLAAMVLNKVVDVKGMV